MKEGGYIVEKFLRELDYDDLVSKLEKNQSAIFTLPSTAV